MGVLGLTPFLLKSFPNVVKELPDRFKQLAGKRIVIDGTLITQRLHFAPSPHPYRHVLGWYNILGELKEFGVSAICVFDGKARSKAKASEAERRREAQRLAATRGSVENSRLRRLDELSHALQHYRSLDLATQRSTISLLQIINLEPDATLSSLKDASQAPMTTNDHYQDMAAHASVIPPWRDVFPHGYPNPSHFTYEDEQDVLGVLAEEYNYFPLIQHRANDQVPPTLDADCSPSRRNNPEDSHSSVDNPLDGILLDDDAPRVLDPQSSEANHSAPLAYYVEEFSKPSVTIENQLLEPQSTMPNISQTLVSLYLQYRQSIAKLASLSALPVPSSYQPDPVDSLMTKAQYQLTVAEGALWNRLVSPSAPDEDIDLEPESVLTSLTSQSRAMYESYCRRTNTPTQRTYRESQDIIRAMGVPCIEPDGPFEAEALASSMVLEGLADYVASEDTDVLVYEAPLIRNITSRQAPLILISGTDVRQALELDRSAYVDFVLLLGTDFSQRIRNVGPSRALKFIKEHGSIERILESEIKCPPRITKQEYLNCVNAAREIFQTLPPTPRTTTIEQCESEDAEIMRVMQRYGLGHVVTEGQQYYASALDGNYFQDNPSGT